MEIFMETKERPKGEIEEHNFPQDVANQTGLVDESRRRFTKAGVAVSGVLLTLASRPSLGGGGTVGGGGVCKSPSGFLSGNASHHGTTQYCKGCTPGYWGTHYTWPSPYKTGTCTNTQFKQQYSSWSNIGSNVTMYNNSTYGFHCSGYGSKLKPYSMMQAILQTGTGDPYQLGAHCVAALLNARMGWTPVLTEAMVRAMFNDYDSKGYYEPTAGVKWYAPQIVTYLKSTMTL
jgi:hypothetical protein